MEIGTNNLVGAGGGLGYPARHLFHVELALRIEIQRESVAIYRLPLRNK